MLLFLVACSLHHGPIVPCEDDGTALLEWVAPAEVRALVVQARWPGEGWDAAPYRVDGRFVEVACEPGQDVRVSFWGDDR